DYVSQRDFLKINSYPIESVAEYYSDETNFLMTAGAKEKEEKLGYILPDGKTFTPAEFDYASDSRGDRAKDINESVSGLLFKNVKIKYFPEYTVTYWNEDNLGLAIKNNKYGFINKKGKVIVPLIYDDAFPFYNGYASVKKGKKWFYIDKKGKEIQALKEFETSYKPIIENLVLINDKSKEKLKKTRLTTTATGITEYLTKVKRSEYPENLYNL